MAAYLYLTSKGGCSCRLLLDLNGITVVCLIQLSTALSDLMEKYVKVEQEV